MKESGGTYDSINDVRVCSIVGEECKARRDGRGVTHHSNGLSGGGWEISKGLNFWLEVGVVDDEDAVCFLGSHDQNMQSRQQRGVRARNGIEGFE